MTIPRHTMNAENYQRWERGLPLRDERDRTPRVEPEKPLVVNGVVFDSIPNEPIKDFNARMKSVRNEAGVMFTGFDFNVEFESGKVVEGWLIEGDFLKLKARIPAERSDLLHKIRW